MARRVLFLCGLPRRGPSARVRVYEHVARLQAHGFTCRVEPFFRERDFEGFYALGGADRLRRVRAGAAGLRHGPTLITVGSPAAVLPASSTR